VGNDGTLLRSMSMATDGSSNMEDNFYVSDAIIEALNSFVHEGVTRGSVSINGRRVCWVEAGSGQPTVVLEAGRNDISLDWARVIALLARQQVHVVAYDRAGLGMSDPAPTEAVLQRQLADLAAVITHTANGRCILVGHSWGGMLAQLLAFYHPGFVSGMVLVDPAHEDMAASLPAFVQGLVRVFPRRLRPVLNVLGIVPIIQSATARQRARRFTEDLHTRDPRVPHLCEKRRRVTRYCVRPTSAPPTPRVTSSVPRHTHRHSECYPRGST
jgi:pimeloyl-ACP methyl ester carboxylesterase